MISQSPTLVPLHVSWKEAILAAIRSPQPEIVSGVLTALSKIESSDFDSHLRAIADDRTRPSLIRIKALAAVSHKKGPLSKKAFVLLKQLLSSGNLEGGRIEAATILAGIDLSEDQVLETVSLIQDAGPLELPILLNIFEGSRGTDTGLALVEALERSGSANVLLPAELKRMLLRYPLEVYKKAEPFVESLLEREGQREKRLAELESELEATEVSNGKAVFLSGKGACITCHKIGADGREVGPELSTIGSIRTGRDLLESILFPGLTLARDYEPYEIQTHDGQTLLGDIQRETADTVFLLDATAMAKPIARSSIKTIQPGSVSLMPAGLDMTMTKKELLDLVGYLDGLE
ncbi:MAG: c-type cytochrome [Verrucomicrobia bacterium]|nr:c-type cytochrome [Verrucomicrobiota bacterium]